MNRCTLQISKLNISTSESLSACLSVSLSLSLSLSLPPSLSSIYTFLPFTLAHTCTCRYFEFIKETVYRSLSQAQLGGVPGTKQLVKSYLNLVPQLVGLDPGSPWPMVFYCMRCGDLQDALDIVGMDPCVL